VRCTRYQATLRPPERRRVREDGATHRIGGAVKVTQALVIAPLAVTTHESLLGERAATAPRVLVASFVCGSIPFSGLAARLLAGVDLRERGTGTVSGTGLYEVAGFGPLALAGSMEVATGALGPLLAGRNRPKLAAVAGGLAVSGHNWSPFLSGAGGRGISSVLGATLVMAPEATVVMALGLGGGRLLRQTGLGCFLALLTLFPVLAKTRGPNGLLLAACLAAPVLAKRVLGNGPLERERRLGTVIYRLIFDKDRRAMST
jgi:acyl phosphate:glycerol-3-phosphate acyltransferase